VGETAKAAVSIVFAAFLIIAGIYFLYNSLLLIKASPPQVAASLLAAIIGLSLVSAGVTLLRTWLVSKAVETIGQEVSGKK